MKLLFASHGPGLTTGAVKAFLELATYLRDRGIEVNAAVPAEGDLRDALVERRIPTTALGYGWAVHGRQGDPRAYLPAIEQFAAEVQPDAILTNTTVIPWFAQLASDRGVPHGWICVEDMTALGIEYMPDQATALDTIDRLSDMVFVPSLWMRDHYGRLLGRDDVIVAPPQFDRSWPERALFPDAAGSGPLRVITYGSIYPTKNQLEACLAIATAVAQGVDVSLSIMGNVLSGPYNAQLRAVVAEHGLGERVSFLDHDDDPAAVVAEHDVVLVPATIESLGRTMVEGMLMGKALVAAKSPAASERVGVDGGHGFLYEAGSPDDLARTLGELARDRPRLAAVAQAGHRAAVADFVERDTRRPLLDALLQATHRVRPSARTWMSDLTDAGLEVARS